MMTPYFKGKQLNKHKLQLWTNKNNGKNKTLQFTSNAVI